MKIIKVLVDKLPDNCLACRFSVGTLYCLFLATHGSVPTGYGQRHPDCPLALEQDNAKIANEVM